ncbi:MAG: hypothetical protein WAS33_06435 [Candidatus Promineifilaceae bacterium]|nr:hypothetical protein [Anaerolineaceae bacterium]
MSQDDLSKLEIAQLESKLKTAQVLQRTVIGIFVVIVLTWIVLGLWQDNLPVFITTVVLGVVTTVPANANLKRLKAEIARRRGS